LPNDSPKLTRRDLIASALGLSATAGLARALGAQQPQRGQQPSRDTALKRHVVVVGAGAFGGWTALHLLRSGARVTLIDAWGAGNSRSTSGDESRVIRGIYNGRQIYIDMVARALTLWKQQERQWGRTIFHRTGALWMFEGDDAFARTSIVPMHRAGLDAREIPLPEAKKRWPQIDLGGIRSVFFEPEAGYLLARESCELVRSTFVAEGGEYRTAWVTPGAITAGAMSEIKLSEGKPLVADRFVFACGPWIGKVFPDVIGSRVRPTRQEVFYFGVPAGEPRIDEGALPVWVNFGQRLIYGIPSNERRGFKVADDTMGATVDPSLLDRLTSRSDLARARTFLAKRFPTLTRAPVVESRVCQYEYTADGDFIIDRHPRAENVWLVGGGSGHGFKMGPALGEHVASLVLDRAPPRPEFALKRLQGKQAQGKRTA
jgi:sarcosine oxidase